MVRLRKFFTSPLRNAYLYLSVILILFGFFYPAIAQESTPVEEAEQQVRTLWSKVQPYVAVSAIVFLFTSITYLIRLFKKDKLLKKLLNKYVVFQMKNGHRYRGTMRLEFTGMEIISEESRQRGHAPSYIFTNGERDEGIVAYIRYHDMMNERERRERLWELERVYHPPLFYKIGRKIRNMFIALREAVEQAISMLWSSIRKTTENRMGRYNELYRETQGEKVALSDRVKNIEEESTAYLNQESYERLIERLIGTRVKVRTHTGEYTAILKDYNEKHISLMDVKDKDNNGYRDEWEFMHEHKHKIENVNHRDDRGLRCRMEGDDSNGYKAIFENNTPYTIQLGKIILQDDAPRWEKDYKYKHHIAPFSVQRLSIQAHINRRIEPFHNVAARIELNPKNYKNIGFKFRSFRDADIVFPRRYCTIVESAEKYQPELFSLTGLTDVILARQDTEDTAITDKDGKPIHGINVVHGYVTNVNEERIDLKTIDASYSRRWDVENAFARFDAKLRKGFPLIKRLLPFTRTQLIAYPSLFREVHQNPIQKATLAPFIYRESVSAIRYILPIQSLQNKLGIIPSRGKTPLPLKVLALTGNITTEEMPVLERFEYIREHRIIYKAVQDLRTDSLAKSDILWIGAGEIYKAGYRLNIDAEHRIKNFVSQGGIVIVSGQDIKANYKQYRGTGWIPEPLTGIECDEMEGVTPTFHGRRAGIFKSPNVVNGKSHTKPSAIDEPPVRVDDMWFDPLGKWIALAKISKPQALQAHTSPGGEHEASPLLMLPFQSGLYIVTSLRNEMAADIQANQNLMENLLHFSVKWLDNKRQADSVRRFFSHLGDRRATSS